MSAPAVRIYGVPVSTWTRTARMVCVEKGIAHELVPVARASDAHRRLHPFARYPVVEIGDTVEWARELHAHSAAARLGSDDRDGPGRGMTRKVRYPDRVRRWR